VRVSDEAYWCVPNRAQIDDLGVVCVGDVGTAIDAPAVEDAAIRDRSRARADVRRDLKAAQWPSQSVSGDGMTSGPRAGPPGSSPPQRAERSHLSHTGPANRFQEDLRAVSAHTERLPRLAQERQAPVNTWRLAPLVDALQALRGVQCTMAVTTVAETRRLDTRRPPQTTHGLSRPDPRSILPWGAAPSGFPHPKPSSPGPSAQARIRRGAAIVVHDSAGRTARLPGWSMMTTVTGP